MVKFCFFIVVFTINTTTSTKQQIFTDSFLGKPVCIETGFQSYLSISDQLLRLLHDHQEAANVTGIIGHAFHCNQWEQFKIINISDIDKNHNKVAIEFEVPLGIMNDHETLYLSANPNDEIVLTRHLGQDGMFDIEVVHNNMVLIKSSRNKYLKQCKSSRYRLNNRNSVKISNYDDEDSFFFYFTVKLYDTKSRNYVQENEKLLKLLKLNETQSGNIINSLFQEKEKLVRDFELLKLNETKSRNIISALVQEKEKLLELARDFELFKQNETLSRDLARDKHRKLEAEIDKMWQRHNVTMNEKAEAMNKSQLEFNNNLWFCSTICLSVVFVMVLCTNRYQRSRDQRNSNILAVITKGDGNKKFKLNAISTITAENGVGENHDNDALHKRLSDDLFVMNEGNTTQ